MLTFDVKLGKMLVGGSFQGMVLLVFAFLFGITLRTSDFSSSVTGGAIFLFSDFAYDLIQANWTIILTIETIFKGKTAILFCRRHRTAMFCFKVFTYAFCLIYDYLPFN